MKRSLLAAVTAAVLMAGISPAFSSTTNVTLGTTWTQVTCSASVVSMPKQSSYVFSTTTPSATLVGHVVDIGANIPVSQLSEDVCLYAKSSTASVAVVTTTADAILDNGAAAGGGGGGGGDATAANQLTEIGHLANIDASTESLDVKTPTLVSGRVPVDGSGVTQPVSGTFWQATQPVSAASLPLPTGAATAANQVTGNSTLSTLALETGGNLATVATNTSRIPAQGTALAASSTPVVTAPFGTVTDFSGTITTGGTAQTALSASSLRRGFEIHNNDSTNVLCFSVSTTASLTAVGSVCIQAGGYYSGKATGAISIIAATTGHKFTGWAY